MDLQSVARSYSITPLAVSVAVACVGYSFGFSGYTVRWMSSLLVRLGCDQNALDKWSWVLARSFGGAMMALISLQAAACLGYSPGKCGLNLSHLWISLGIVLATIAGLLLLLTLAARFWPSLFRGYPQMLSFQVDTQHFVLNIASWTIYFVGFETLYRGLLIFPLATTYGRWTAVAVSSGIYVVGEIAQQPVQLVQIGLIPVAVGLGTFSLLTGSILGPFLIHSFTASAFDFYAARAQARSVLPGATS